ncbi:MAG: tetratricopeptide repeat protein [Alphaproteobacteria bacterium]|nr:tetratricopeptide repeat protein [Alphaproteobacteria bacterium]
MDDEPVRPVAVAAISRLCARAAQAREAGRLEAARDLLTQASAAARIQTAARHEVAVNINNLAAAYATAQRHDDAIELLRAALTLVPEYALAHANLADLLKSQGRTDAALGHLRRIEEITGQSADNLIAQGKALQRLDRVVEARGCFEAALDLDPGHVGALDGGLYARLSLADWTGIGVDTKRLIELFRLQSEPPPSHLIAPFHSLLLDIAEEDRLRIARAWSLQFPAAGSPRPHTPHPGPLRIGYLSGDFRRHATAYLMQSLFAAHDRTRVRVHAYATGTDDGSVERRKIAADCDRFVDLHRLSDEEAARAIAADEIDIVVDLMGYSGSARPGILARRPAPLQVSYLVYPGTTGAAWIDYIIADPVVLPPANRRWFSEKVVSLPRCFQVSDPGQEIDDSPTLRGEWGLPDDVFVFACFNIAHKIEPKVFGLWMEILREVPRSVLWLLADSDTVTANLRAAAASAEVDPARLLFAKRVCRPRHLRRQQYADLFLDTLICNAHTTASDALFVGLPLLTVAGPSFAGRVAASLLTTLGVEELIAADGAGYRETAIALARDPDRLAQLRGRIVGAAGTGPLFDVGHFAGAIESAFELIWENHSVGNTPRHIDVPPFAPSNGAKRP